MKDIPPGVSVVGIPARVVGRESAQKFAAYGTPSPDLPDPVSRAIDGLLEQVGTLSTRVEELERQLNRLAEVAPDCFEDTREEPEEKKPTAC